jgi:hypothetical protein
MSTLTPVASLDNVIQLENGQVASGGPNGIMNQQAQSLLNRTAYLLAELEQQSANLAAAGAGQGAGLIGFQQAGAGSVVRTMQSKASDFWSLPDLVGGTGNGVTDNTAAFGYAKANGVTRVYLPAGHYLVNGSIDLSNMEIWGDGDATLIDCTQSTANYPLYTTGSYTALPALSSNASLGSWRLTFTSAPAINVGDVLFIYNATASSWSGFRTYYNQGEWCEILGISGNTVTLRGPLYDSYVAGAVTVYKLGGSALRMRDLKITGGTGSVGLLNPSLCIDPLLEKITVIAQNDSALYLDRCFRGSLRDLKVVNTGQGSSANPYGLIICNSQHVRVQGGDYFGRWGGTDFGGNSGIGCVPNRDCLISKAIIRNDMLSPNNTTTTQHAAGMHGNSEQCGYVDCTIYGGVGLSGADPFVRGGSVYSQENGVIVDGSEVLGGIYNVENVKMFSMADPFTSTRGFIDVGGNSTAITSSTTRDVTIRVTGGSIKVSSVSSDATAIIKWSNQGTSVNINTELSSVSLGMPAAVVGINGTYVSGTAASQFTIVEKLANLPTGSVLASLSSQYVSFPLRMQRQAGYVNGTTTASTSYIASPVALNFTYPREPRVTCALTGAAGASMGLLAGQVGVAGHYQISSSSVRPLVQTASTMTSGVNFELHWTAGLDEC